MVDLETALNTEKIVKKTECKHGTIVLTENHFIWKTRTKEIPNCIIQSEKIQKIQKSSKPGLGFGIMVSFGENGAQKNFFPIINLGFPPSPNLVEIEDWVSCFKSEPLKPKQTEFTNIVYAGGHSAHPEKHNGKLILTENSLIFQELSILSENSLGKFRLEIPITSITNISLQSTAQISRLTTVLIGPLWSMGFPEKHKLVLVEYFDDVKLKYVPIFDFPGDFGDKKKAQVMQKLHAQMRKLRPHQKNEKAELDEPIKILKIRFAKGEINKEQYFEMKKILEQE